MFNISLHVLLFHHFDIDQATAIMAKKKTPKQNETKTKPSSIMEIQVSAHFFLLNLYYIHIILFMAPELERKNNTSCKTCLVINLEIKIIQFPLTPVPISPCIFPCTVLFVESASSHRSARSLETLVFFGCNMSARLERLTMRKIIMRRNGWKCTLRIRVDSLIYRRLSKSRLLCT